MAIKKLGLYCLTHAIFLTGKSPFVISSPSIESKAKPKDELSMIRAVDSSFAPNFDIFPIRSIKDIQTNERPLKLDASLTKDTLISPRFMSGWNWVGICKKSVSQIVDTIIHEEEDLILFPYGQNEEYVPNVTRVLFLDLNNLANMQTVFAYDRFEGKFSRVGTIFLQHYLDTKNIAEAPARIIQLPHDLSGFIEDFHKISQPYGGYDDRKRLVDLSEAEIKKAQEWNTWDGKLGAFINLTERRLFGKVVSGLGNVDRNGWNKGHPVPETIISFLHGNLSEEDESGNTPEALAVHLHSCLKCSRTALAVLHPDIFSCVPHKDKSLHTYLDKIRTKRIDQMTAVEVVEEGEVDDQ